MNYFRIFKDPFGIDEDFLRIIEGFVKRFLRDSLGFFGILEGFLNYFRIFKDPFEIDEDFLRIIEGFVEGFLRDSLGFLKDFRIF